MRFFGCSLMASAYESLSFANNLHPPTNLRSLCIPFVPALCAPRTRSRRSVCSTFSFSSNGPPDCFPVFVRSSACFACSPPYLGVEVVQGLLLLSSCSPPALLLLSFSFSFLSFSCTLRPFLSEPQSRKFALFRVVCACPGPLRSRPQITRRTDNEKCGNTRDANWGEEAKSQCAGHRPALFFGQLPSPAKLVLHFTFRRLTAHERLEQI